MKKAVVMSMMESGFVGFIAEYRGSKAETIQYVDKTSGRAASLKSLRHNLEVGETAVAFNERVPNEFDAVNYKPPFAKGTKVLVHLTSYQNDKGVFRASGRLEALE